MSKREMSSEVFAARLPTSLAAKLHGSVAVLKLNRPQKRNALDDETIIGIEQFFTSLPEDIGAVLIAGDGEHFSAGLDLTELKERNVTQGIAHSGLWHRAFDKMQYCMAQWWAAVSSLRPPRMCASPSAQPITHCRKAVAASMSAAAARCDCRR